MENKNLKLPIVFIVELTSTGYGAYSEVYPIFTTGKDVNSLTRNALEATNFYFEELKSQLTLDDLSFVFDLKEFFNHYKVLNARTLAKRIGINPTLLSQYVNGKKKPSLQQTTRIFEGVNQLGQELQRFSFS